MKCLREKSEIEKGQTDRKKDKNCKVKDYITETIRKIDYQENGHRIIIREIA